MPGSRLHGCRWIAERMDTRERSGLSDTTLLQETPTLPSAMHHFTAEFGMESGDTNALMPPGKPFETLASKTPRTRSGVSSR